MNKRIKISLFITLVLFSFTTREAQSGIPDKCYYHFIGKINSDKVIDMNIIKIYDSLYGNYSFVPNKATSSKLPDNNSRNVVQLCGKVGAHGELVIRENPWEKGASFTGKLIDSQIFQGIWQSEDGNLKYPFELKENYSDGGLQMNVYFQKGSVPLVNKKNSPKATFQYCFLSPKESNDDVFIDSLTNMIAGNYIGKQVLLIKPENLLNAMKQIYYENYFSTNESIYSEAPGASFDWESLKFMDIILNNAHLLTFYIEQYSYTGGAHGLQTRDYTVVNLRTGKPVSLNELFFGEYNVSLTEIITDHLRKQYHFDADKKLTEIGFFVESIKPTNNYYVTINGIGFYYNHYEIAPYSQGPVDIFIPFEDFKGLRLNGGILKDLKGYSFLP